MHPQNQLQETLSKKRKAEDALEHLLESTAIANAAAARLQEALLVHSQTITNARATAAQGPPPPVTAPRVAAAAARKRPTTIAAAAAATTTSKQPPAPTTGDPHYLVSTTMTGSTLGRHARIICELCRLAIRGASANKTMTTTTTAGDASTSDAGKPDGGAKPRADNRGIRVAMCCPTCRLGFHQECFVAYHFTESFRDCNPELYQRVTELKQLTNLRYMRDAVSIAIPVKYMETLVIPSMKKKQPGSTSESTTDQETTTVV